MTDLIYAGGENGTNLGDTLRDTYIELFREDPKVVHIDADLLRCVSLLPLREQYPGNIIDCGIQEANAVGVAAGMYLAGYKPYVHSFGPFVSRRVFDTAFISVAYARKSVRILGSDPGIMAKANGGTHMPFEDMGLYRTVPEAAVIDITDAAMLRSMIRNSKDRPGLTYIRMPRKGIPDVYRMGTEFEIGKAKVLREGTDVTIIASGIMTATALDAAELLADKGISAEVIDPVSVKPLDRETILGSAGKTGAVVTAENHNIIGGLGSAVCELLSENLPVPVRRIGAEDRFGQVGDVSYLRKEYRMTKEDIVRAVQQVVDCRSRR